MRTALGLVLGGLAAQLIRPQDDPPVFGDDCYTVKYGEVVCDSGSGNEWRPPRASDANDCMFCHHPTVSVPWHLDPDEVSWPLDPVVDPGIFLCWLNGYYAPTPSNPPADVGLGPAGGPPPPLSFADEGAVVYTNPIDPKKDSTRNNVYVDPASGAFRFRLPLDLEFKGRSGTISLEMLFNSSRNRPGGTFGNFWAGSWEQKLYADFIWQLGDPPCGDDDPATEDGPPESPVYLFMDNLVRIFEHHGASTTVWTNEAAIEKDWTFDDVVDFGIPDTEFRFDGIPSGNLHGAGKIRPPNGTDRFDYELIADDEFLYHPGRAKFRTEPLGPTFFGDPTPDQVDDPQRFLSFVPPLGDDRRMRHDCGVTEIRWPDGRIDRFGPFHVLGEHWVPLPNHPEWINPFRSEWGADLIETVFPNGDKIGYKYDQHGRLAWIVDEFGRQLVDYIYDTDTLRLIAIDDLTGRVVAFDYDDNNLVASITLPRAGQTWSFSYVSHLVEPPIFELREIIQRDKIRVIDSLEIQAPADPQNAAVSATFTSISAGPGGNEQPCVTQMTLGGAARDFDLDENGTPDYSFSNSLTVNYTYAFDPNDELGDYTTTITDSLGHQRIHVFDWQSREKSRTERVLYQGSTTDQVTTFSYAGFHPKFVETVLPRGNKVTEHYQFQEDDVVPALSYYDDGPRDRFAQHQLLWRQKTGFAGETAILEFWTYEPIFQQVWSYTDPRGFVTESTYDYQEWNFDEEFDALLDRWHLDRSVLTGKINLGDVNGDGLTDQHAGRRIKLREPLVQTPSLTTQHYGAQESISLFLYNEKGQIIKEYDPVATVKTYTYYSGPGPHEGVQVTTAGGFLGSVTEDFFGAHLVTEYGYDALGRNVWTRNPRGFHVVRTFNESNAVIDEIAGNVSQAGVPLGGDWKRVQFDYDLNGNLVEKRAYIDTSVTPELDYAGANPGWVTTRVGYDSLDEVRAVAEERFDPRVGGPPFWNLTWFHYDGNGRTIKEVSAAGRAISYAYDSLGRVKRKRRHATFDSSPHLSAPPADTNADAVLDFGHDLNGNLVSATILGDSTSHGYSIVYDGFDRRVQLTDPVGTLTTQTLDAAGNITRVQVTGKRLMGDSGSGILRDAEYFWDERNRLAKTRSAYFQWVDQGGHIVREDLPGGTEFGYVHHDFACDARGLKTFERDDLGRESEFVYDGARREIRTYQPLVTGYVNRNYREVVYDGNDNVVQEILHSFGIENGVEQEETHEVTWTYDGLDRKLEERRQPQAPNPIVTTFAWSSLGDRIRTVNPNGIGTKSQFDTLHREVVTELGWNSTFTAGQIVDTTYNPDGLIRTEREFDGQGKLLVQRDDSGNPTQWVYDALERLTDTIQADLSKEKLSYDRSGVLRTETRTFDQSGSDALFCAVNYQYDQALRKVRADFNLNQAVSGLSGVFLEEFAYDGVGRVVHGTSDAYVPNSTDIHKTIIGKEYDSLDRVLCDDQGFTIDRASTLDYTSAVCVSSTYDGVGNRTQVSTTNYVRNYSYDELNRIQEIRDGFGALLHGFTWIGARYRLNAQQNLNGTSSRVGFAGYDVHRRLKQVDHLLPGGSAFATFLYEYDPIGNQLKEIKGHVPGDSHRFTYDAGNRLTKFEAGNNGTAFWTQRQTFNLDGVGNWRKHRVGATTYTNTVDPVHEYGPTFDNATVAYDQRGNLKQFSNKNFVYDARGRIVAATVGAGARQDYAYDVEGRRLAAEGWVSVYEGLREIRQVKISQSSQTRTYTYGAGLDEVLLYETNGVRYYLHQNRNGSTIALTNAAGSVVERYDYTPYGVATMQDVDGGGLIRSPYLFAGRRWDQGSGLYFLRARSYLPDMGRFTSRDPIGFWCDANNWGNPFTYLANNPFEGVDPLGLGPDWFENAARAVAQWLVDNGYDDEFKSAGGAFVGFVDDQTLGLSSLAVETLTGESLDSFKSDPEVAAGYAKGQDASQLVDIATGVKGVTKPGIKAASKLGKNLTGAAASAALKAADDIGEAAAKGVDGAATAGRAAGDAAKGGAHWGNPKTLARHFRDHGADFGAKNADDYARQASDFLRSSQAGGLPTKIDADGVIRVFDPKSNTFGAFNPDGTTRTFFKPSSPTYWDRQPGSAPWTPK